MKLLLFTVLFFIVAHSGLLGQKYKMWQIITNSGVVYPYVTIQNQTADSLYVNGCNVTSAIHIDAIKSIRHERESRIGMGFLIGAAGGGAIGLSTKSSGYFSEERDFLSTILYTVIGGFLGSIIGGISGADEFYDMERINHQQKLVLLAKIRNN